MALSQIIKSGHVILPLVEQLTVSWRLKIRLQISYTFLTNFPFHFLLKEVLIVVLNLNVVRVMSRLRMLSV